MMHYISDPYTERLPNTNLVLKFPSVSTHNESANDDINIL